MRDDLGEETAEESLVTIIFCKVRKNLSKVLTKVKNMKKSYSNAAISENRTGMVHKSGHCMELGET